MNFIKTAISLPAETYQKSEKIRKKWGKSRSQFIADAVAALIKAEEIREAEARDTAAWLKNPETAEEIAQIMAATEAAWKQFDDDWTEEYNATR